MVEVTITYPQEGETVSAADITVEWGYQDVDLEKYNFVVYLDGNLQTTTTSSSHTLYGISEGTHTVLVQVEPQGIT